jgi:hypothetical protein
MIGLRYRESLSAATLDELEALVAGLRAYLLTEHNEDGTHRQGVWQSYAVRWTASPGFEPAVGNGLLVGRYMRVGRTVFYVINLAFGSGTTAGTGSWTFSVPVPAGKHAIHTGVVYGFGASAHYVAAAVVSRGQTGLAVVDPNGVWDASTPHAWTDGDGIVISGSYEISDEVVT